MVQKRAKMTNRELMSEVFLQTLCGKIGIDSIPKTIEIEDIEYSLEKLQEDLIEMFEDFNTSDDYDWYNIEKKWIHKIREM